MLKRLKSEMLGLKMRVNKKIAIAVSAAIITGACCGVAYAAPNTITIADTANETIQIRTNDTNVGRILAKQGIVLNDGDKVNYDLSDNIKDDAVISIVRAFSVDIYYMGETRNIITTECNVAKILETQGIQVNDECLVTPALNENVGEGDVITVITRDTHEISVQEEIPFNTTETENPSLPAGERIVVQEGKCGVKEYCYTIRYENGAETDRALTSEVILSNPVDEIIEYGPESVWELGVIPASRPTNYSRMETFTATAYDASPMDNGQWAGKTSTGMPLQYGVIAVDPNVIPYGTKMYIESADGQYIYGYAIAGDCGGAIKGKKVDLFFASRSTCYQFGKRAVNIYFMD